MIAPITQVGTGPVHASVATLSDRPIGKFVFGMLCAEAGGRGKDDLIVFVAMYGYVGPVEERVNEGRRIEYFDGGFYIRFVGIESQSYCPSEPMAEFGFAYPYCAAAIGISGQRVVDREMGGSPVMVGNVPFDASRHPGSDHADQSRFYYVLPIKEIIAGRFVLCPENTSSQFRHDANLSVLIFKPDRSVGFVVTTVGEYVVHRIRINVSLCTLISSSGVKVRIRIGRSYFLWGKRQGFFFECDSRLRTG